MRRSALLTLLVAALAPTPAWADDAGGASAPDSVPVDNVGGQSTPPRGGEPVARLSAPSLPAPGKPSINVRFSGIGRLHARVVVLRLPRNSVVARIPLGSV